MNPFGLFQALLALVEGVVHAADPNRQRETRKERRRFLFFYIAFMLLCTAALVWVLRSLYFAK